MCNYILSSLFSFSSWKTIMILVEDHHDQISGAFSSFPEALHLSIQDHYLKMAGHPQAGTAAAGDADEQKRAGL